MTKRRFANRIRDILGPAGRILERQILLFPVVVTLLAMTTLLCGGSVQTWHWWGAVALVCGGALWLGRSSPRRTLVALLAFAAMLGLVWVFTWLQPDRGWHDPVGYHLPAIRLLMEGWNPIYAATPEAIAETMGVNPSEMWFWHVLAMPKSAWIFSAAAAKFTQAPMALFFPIFPFLFATAAATVWRFFGERKLWVRLLALGVLWAITPAAFFTLIDRIQALGAIALLAGMGCVLKGRRPDWTALIVHSFWMASSKQIGAISCVLFWVLFSCAWLWQERQQVWPVVRRLACVAAVIGALLCVVGISPYLTMWLNYGHPLYPVKTTDEAVHPTVNIVADFYNLNADARAMGHLGSFVNAYISPSLAVAYYRWKLDRETFVPMGETWSQHGELGSPQRAATRIPLLICFAILLLLGGRLERLMGISLTIGLLLMPTVMLGYMRYIPWIWFSALLALHAATGVSPRIRWLGYGAVPVVIVALLPTFLRTVTQASAQIDAAYAADRLLQARPDLPVYCWIPLPDKASIVDSHEPPTQATVYYDPNHFGLAHLRLLCRQDPRLTRAVVRDDILTPPLYETLVNFPGMPFLVPRETDAERYSLFESIAKEPSLSRRIRQYPAMVLDVWLVRFPSLLWERLCSLVD